MVEGVAALEAALVSVLDSVVEATWDSSVVTCLSWVALTTANSATVLVKLFILQNESIESFILIKSSKSEFIRLIKPLNFAVYRKRCR